MIHSVVVMSGQARLGSTSPLPGRYGDANMITICNLNRNPLFASTANNYIVLCDDHIGTMQDGTGGFALERQGIGATFSRW